MESFSCSYKSRILLTVGEKMKKKAAIITCFFFLFSIANAGFTNPLGENTKVVINGNTLYVGGSGPNNYTSIQDAINDASDGDTIFVYNGTYRENVVIDKSITLLGEDKNATIIDGGRKDNVVNITAPSVIISNFTITNSSYYKSAGIKICNSKCRVSGCNIFYNLCYGIWIIFSSNNEIANCNISYNGEERGILIEKSFSNRIVNCAFLYNRQGGISLLYSHDDVISNSIFISNRAYGVWIISSNNETISGCKFINDGLFIQGDTLSHFLHEIKNDTVDGLPLLYYKNMRNVTIDGMQVGEIIFVNCTKSKLQNIDLNNKKVGIEIAFGEENEIYNCNMEGVDEPLTILYSSYNDVHSCNLKNCEGGFTLFFSSKNMIHECNILEGGGGIMMWQSSFNKIYCCNISGTTNSVSLFGYLTFGNFIANNNFVHNKWDPVFINSLHNIWLRNYWDNWHLLLPKPIFGINFICYIIQIPWVQFDWMPSLKLTEWWENE